MKRTLVGLISLAFLAACSPGQDGAAAEKSVASFHQNLDAAQYDAIYDGADPILRQASNREQFVRLLDAVHRKLGAFKSTTRQNWRENFTTSGHTYVGIYNSTYEKGQATESFTFLVGKDVKLAGYFINSNALIEN